MKDKIANAAGNDPLPGRNAYSKPALKEFGSVGQLTQGGTAGQNEPNGGPGQSDTTKRN